MLIILFQKHCDENKIIPQPPSPHAQSVPANSVKLVCDTMLQGLGKSLRRCGIDAAILENEQNHTDCVQLYHDEKRYILTRGQIFNKVLTLFIINYIFFGYLAILFMQYFIYLHLDCKVNCM